ncbi:Hypothetical predicted protein [Mytilus galloprovincialis]|uniref:Uncharacterized protein n=1 Tax=Mytilus galloprovincialis TaxID=29158 RepID=A0A8B6H8F4_MYTGA|nr:Hypothetical predicted protein [Mytilus galloprovincialis]
MAFDAGKFLKTPDLESFDNLKKEELVLLAKHLKLDFKVSMRKQIIKNLVIDKLVDAKVLGEEALELKVENIDAFKLKQLELEHELKLKELEIRKEDELKLKQDELKLKQAELEMKERLEMEKIKEKEDEFNLLRFYGHWSFSVFIVRRCVAFVREDFCWCLRFVLQGVELGCIDVPLHRIYLSSDLITGPVIVGVRPNLPVEGVTLLLGNDLARNKVVAEPIVTSEQCGC